MFSEKWLKSYQSNSELLQKQRQSAIKYFDRKWLDPLKTYSLFSQDKILDLQLFSDSTSQKLINRLQPLLEIVQSPEYFKNMQKLADRFKALEHFNQTMDSSAPLLRDYHWLIPNSMSYRYIRNDIFAVLTSGDVNQSKIDDVFVAYYTHNNFENMDQVLENCRENGMEIERLQIIQDCILILRNQVDAEEVNVHNLIIPTLMVHLDRLYGDIRKLFIERYNLTSKKSMSKAFELHRSDLEDEEAILNISIDMVIEYIFRDSGQIDRDEDPHKHTHLYRNKILHGESLAYGNLANTIRTFLILEVLAGFHSELKEKFDQESLEELPVTIYLELIKSLAQIHSSDPETQSKLIISVKNEVSDLYQKQHSRATHDAKTLFLIEKIIENLNSINDIGEAFDLVAQMLRDLHSKKVDMSKFRTYLESLFELGIIFPRSNIDEIERLPQ